MRITRRAEHQDLASLLEVYRHVNPVMPVMPEERTDAIWAKTLASKDTGLFVSVVDGRVGSTCLPITGPNLMRGGASHALLENVGTHRDHLRQGHGRATIGFALNDAWGRGAVMCFWSPAAVAPIPACSISTRAADSRRLPRRD